MLSKSALKTMGINLGGKTAEAKKNKNKTTIRI
jgi:hypothetical protein